MRIEELLSRGCTEHLTNNPVKKNRVRYYKDLNDIVVAKACTDCKEIKEMIQFPKTTNGFQGFAGRCKVCLIKYKSIKNNETNIDRPRNPKTNRPINSIGINETETEIQYLRRQYAEGKLIYDNGHIYTTFDGRGKGRQLEKPVKVGAPGYRGYERYSFRFNGKLHQVSTHRLIYCLLNNLDNLPEGLVINHINGDKMDNRIENLELVTQKRNINHALDTGLRRVENNNTAKLTWSDVDEIRDILKSQSLSDRKIGDMYGVSPDTIRKIRTGKSWNRRYLND